MAWWTAHSLCMWVRVACVAASCTDGLRIFFHAWTRSGYHPTEHDAALRRPPSRGSDRDRALWDSTREFQLKPAAEAARQSRAPRLSLARGRRSSLSSPALLHALPAAQPASHAGTTAAEPTPLPPPDRSSDRRRSAASSGRSALDVGASAASFARDHHHDDGASRSSHISAGGEEGSEGHSVGAREERARQRALRRARARAKATKRRNKTRRKAGEPS